MESGNKKYEVIISGTATEQVISHVRFLAQVSEQAAEQLRITIMKAVATLENYPERHPWLSDPMLPTHKYRKMSIDKRYLLIYQIKLYKVYVEYIVDSRQDYQWLL